MSTFASTRRQHLVPDRCENLRKSPSRSSLSTCSATTEATSTNVAQIPTGGGDSIALRLGSGHLWSQDPHTILRQDGRQAFSNGLNIRLKQSSKSSSSKNKTKGKKLILRDDDKRVICVLATSSQGLYVLYRPIPLCEGQKPTKITSNSKMGLYEWAQINFSTQIPILKAFDGSKMSFREGLFENDGIEQGFLSKSGYLHIQAGHEEPMLVLSFALAVNDVQSERQKGDQPSLQELAMSLMAMSAPEKMEPDQRDNSRISAAIYKKSNSKRMKRRASTGTRAA